ncbi:hypothetical protein F0562_002813 [Nyssa sinensis]|uniref:BRCT domain-containing protein n=1 Tax=Nyssa sinensis TaxID=561372 RepID=A0A5J5BUI9_9ASTE|nr:hypothetical protein F0562_002813 [Nyssa sinensis]
MMMKTFKGANVFMSRNLVPPEIFDSLHDALKHNGAEVFLCCDPKRNGPNDYHIISSPDHEKFDDLRNKGCNLLGPQCVLSCAKEHRVLPKQGFTCCLAMDAVKILASGFEMDEKVEIGKLVTAMGGVLHPKASMDVSFVIVKNVLAAKYKWASNILKKPIVTINWLHQCWKEHRVVPQESFRVLPFSGLTICVTRIPADERKEMEKLVVQNGGKYSAELTKKCTHLDSSNYLNVETFVSLTVNKLPKVTNTRLPKDGVTFILLLGSGLINLLLEKGGSASFINTVRTCLTAQHSQDKGIGNLQHVPSSMAADSSLQTGISAGSADPDLEATLSQNMSSTFSDAPVFVKEENGAPAMQPKRETNFDGCVANDSQTEDNDLYLSECRILLVGFDASEIRKLVNMVRRGGGSRYMSFNEKLTHVVVGTPSEIEKREVRGLAALGVIYVVRTIWLEDCDREKKELSVLQQHIAYDLLLPKDPICSNKGVAKDMTGMKQGKTSTVQSKLPDDQTWGNMNSGCGISSEKSKEPEANRNNDSFLKATVRSKQNDFCVLNDNDKGQQKIQHGSSHEIQEKSASVFKGRLFRFSNCFPQDRRAEIVQWVNQGGGEVVDDQIEQNVHFTVECHGVVPSVADATRSTHVSSHWIRSCLEDGCLLDVGSHILFSPLPCRIPLPGFKSFRLCISQYDEKDRLLMRNLCFVLGAKFVEKLTKKVTHLLCKFSSGPKYEAACRWGIQSVTCEWIYECVKQNEVVALGPFCPKEVTSQDREAGFCTMSQYPTQAVQMISGDTASQFPSQSQDLKNIKTQVIGCRSDSFGEEDNHSTICNKRARLLEDDSKKALLSSGVNQNDSTLRMNSTENKITEGGGEVSPAIPDVASAIEDLLEQTSKVGDS